MYMGYEYCYMRIALLRTHRTLLMRIYTKLIMNLACFLVPRVAVFVQFYSIRQYD